MSFTQVTLTGTYKMADGTAAAGTVQFTASAAMQNGTDMRPPIPVTATLVNGAFSVVLSSTQDAGTTPTGVTYEVIENIAGAPMRAYSIQLSTATPQDLSAVAPAIPIATSSVLLVTNNLSDLNNAATARTNLGLAAGAVAPLYIGSGDPEGAITAAVGSVYLRTDGGIGTFAYVKSSGTGNTGWTSK